MSPAKPSLTSSPLSRASAVIMSLAAALTASCGAHDDTPAADPPVADAVPRITAVSPKNAPARGAVRTVASAADLDRRLRGLGYRARGGIDRAKTESGDARVRSFPHFTSSFKTGGVTYPFTMVGYPPASGRETSVRSVIIPLRMNFVGFADETISLEPTKAVDNIVRSPLYQPAQFPNGYGQFGDQMQRAAFWNQMDRDHSWHVRMAAPRVLRPINIEVTPETGTLSQVTVNGAPVYFGDVLIDFMDAQAQTIIQLAGLEPDVVPIFVTGMVTAEALGYHNAAAIDPGDGGTNLQTYIYTSWLDPTIVNPLVADVSTFNHELLEWMNDPYINNVVPVWQYPPASDPNTVCSDNNGLEVGDPQGNGPTYPDYPTVVVNVGGTAYHLQQLVLWQWFTGNKTSSAYKGWFTFPDPTSLKEPAVFCP